MVGNIRKESWRDFDADVARGAPRVLGLSLGVFVIILLLIVAVGAFTWFWAPWKGQVEQRSLTEGSGVYRIASYEWYFDQCNSVVASENKIENLRDSLKDTKDETQRGVLRAAVTAQENVRFDLIAEYNANAAKEETRAMFKDDGLPATINPEENTSCAA